MKTPWPPFLGLVAFLTLTTAQVRAEDPPRWTDVGGGLAQLSRLEFVRMTTAILSGSSMSPGDGWFGPSQSRWDARWLMARLDRDKNGRISPEEFQGPREWFTRLDRNQDGVITVGDLDWSSTSQDYQQFRSRLGPAFSQFARIDTDSNGKITRSEWQSLFEQLAGKKDFLAPEDLQLFFSPPRPAPGKPTGAGGGPSRLVLLRGLLSGEIGSPCEGPALGSPAPGFTLPTPDGAMTLTLDPTKIGRPVVLVFGSFT